MQIYNLDYFTSQDSINQLISTVCQNDIIEIQITYISDFKSAKILRELVDSLCKGIWINPKWRTRLVLIIDELNNNAIEYWSKADEDNIFYIKFKKEDKNRIFIDSYVSDTGNGAYAKKSQDMEKLRNIHEKKDFSSHNSIRWRGLFLIISQLVDTLYFKDSKSWGLTVGIQKLLEEDSKK